MKKVPKSFHDYDENVLQFDGGDIEAERYLDWSVKTFPKTCMVIVHNPRSHLLTYKDREYRLSYNACDGASIQGYYVFERKRHVIYICKINYICVSSEAFVLNQKVDVSKLILINPNFQHLKILLYVVTVQKCNEPTDYISAHGVFKFVRADSDGSPFVIFGDFMCQNWDYVRNHVFPNQVLTSGQFNVPTRKVCNKISSTIGCVIADTGKEVGSYELDINYSKLLYSTNELYWNLWHLPMQKKIFKLNESSEKLASYLNTEDFESNYMRDKNVPSINEIDCDLKIKKCEFLGETKKIFINDIFSYLLNKKWSHMDNKEEGGK
jgi:hypothetical protein